MTQNLKLGFFLEKKWRGIRNILPKIDLEELLKMVDVNLPAKISYNKCQGVEVDLKTDFSAHDIDAFDLKLSSKEKTFHYKKKIKLNKKIVVDEETNYIFKKEDIVVEQIKLKSAMDKTNLNITFMNEEDETIEIEVTFPKYISTIKVKKIFEELKEYMTEKPIPEIASYMEKQLLEKIDLNIYDIQLMIKKTKKEEYSEKAIYFGKELKKIWKNNQTSNYSIEKEGKAFKKIEIHRKRKDRRGVLYHITIYGDRINVYIGNMNRTQMSPELKDVIEAEKTKAMKIFNSKEMNR